MADKRPPSSSVEGPQKCRRSKCSIGYKNPCFTTTFRQSGFSQPRVTETQCKWSTHKNAFGSRDLEDERCIRCRAGLDASMVLLGIYLSPFLASDFPGVFLFSGRLFLPSVHLATQQLSSVWEESTTFPSAPAKVPELTIIV